MHHLYRLYIDEVGNHDMKPTLADNERYLTLFGVIVQGSHMLNTIQPQMRAIKQAYFQQDPDDPVIFHRKEISRFRGSFSSLSDRKRRQAFGDDMLRLYESWNYTAIAVTIDKIAHFDRYSTWRYEPYHYCLATMVERFVLYLHYRNLRGDVMVEARGSKPDQRLKASFQRLWEKGTDHIPFARMQARLTSKSLKVKSKSADVAGLQLADLLAHAAHYDNLVTHGHAQSQVSDYGRQIAEILRQNKYYRGNNGEIRGYGQKMLP